MTTTNFVNEAIHDRNGAEFDGRAVDRSGEYLARFESNYPRHVSNSPYILDRSAETA